MIGEKKMPKREIKHINGNKTDSKEMANAKKQEFVNVEWESTPTWSIMSFDNNKKTDYFGKIDKDGE